MEIKKAIITAASQSQRTLPLQTLVDRDGATKTALRILVEELQSAGVHEICVVVHPGDQAAYAAAAGQGTRLQFVEQTESLGYGHAVFCARDFVQKEPFILMVGDHLYVSGAPKRSAQQLVEIARAENCAVSAVQATHESKLVYYGAVGGRLVAGREGLYEISEVLEKPTPTEAEQRLIVPGLRAGHYLCFFGMHVLTSVVMELLAEQIKAAPEPDRDCVVLDQSQQLEPKSPTAAVKKVSLTNALARLARHERYLACELKGRRYDIGLKYGLLTAQLALALSGQDREEVLSNMVELLARRA